ncbi:hypothetical protein MSAN_02041600 [Mycena sanguinolenta]|uniref:Transmembrane protein n=1 Tax=Mycena sanguinolenta TaxID=230812 RepID=A0A8H7CLB4_9AGAR|nr:hypothetical protein MSAN_02041600 [Mycena sanguinolenta]
MSHLENTLELFFIGYVFAAVGFGFTFFQSYLYHTTYPKDRWLVKVTVASLCTLDTAMSALSSHALYYYLVTLFSLPVGPDNATISFCGIAIAIVQSFYAVRIWQISRNAFLPAAIILLSIAGAALGIATSVVILRNTLFANFSEQYMKAVISTGQGIRLLAALTSAGGSFMCNVKVGGTGKPSRWDLITNFLTSGVAGAVAQFLCLVTFIAMPQKYVWIIFHFLSSRVFINGLLLILNSRAVSRGRGINEEETRGATSTLQTSTTASSIMFNSNRTNHTFNVDVSHVINSDTNTAKYPDNSDPVKEPW